MIEKLTASFCLLKKELLLITADSVCGFVLSKVLSNTDVVGGIAMMEMIVLVHCTRRSLLALGFPRASGFTLRQVRAARYSCTYARDAGYTLAEAKDAGYTLAEATAAGYTLCREAKAPQFSGAGARNAG